MYPFGPDPMRIFAVRALASLEAPTPTKPALQRFRTAVFTTLAAAGLDIGNVAKQSSASFKDTKHHTLIVWYDVAAGALRLFAPTSDVIDDISLDALTLLNGQVVLDLSSIPIEDVDATTRLMALMSMGGEDAADLRERFVGRNLSRYDEDFTPPTVADLEELWGRLFKTYVGGTTHPPDAIDVWIERVFAFGVGWFPPVEKAKRKPKAKAKAKAKAKPKAKPKAKAKAKKPAAKRAPGKRTR